MIRHCVCCASRGDAIYLSFDQPYRSIHHECHSSYHDDRAALSGRPPHRGHRGLHGLLVRRLMPSRTALMSALAEYDTSPSDSTLWSDGLPAIRLSELSPEEVRRRLVRARP